MAHQQILLILATFLHDLFTVIWIGGLVTFSLTVIPSSRKTFGNSSQAMELMNTIFHRQRIWVYLSIIGLFVTGIIQARMQPSFHGSMQFDTPYSALFSAKHLATFLMIAVALVRSLKMGGNLKTVDARKNKFNMTLVFFNTGLGVLILFMSGWLAAL